MNPSTENQPVRNKLLSEADATARGNPLGALIAAVGIGMAIGLIIRALERPKRTHPLHDSVDEIRALLKPFAKRSRKAYGQAVDAVEEAIETARDRGVENVVEPMGNWWRRLWS